MARQGTGGGPKIDKDALLAAALMQNQKQLEHIANLTEQVEKLTAQVEELTRELNKNSSNSNNPPSSDRLGE